MSKAKVNKKTNKPENPEDLHLSSQVASGFAQNIFEDIVLGFPDIIHSVDDKGKIVSTNKKAMELLGYKRHELVGKDVMDLYPDDLREQVKHGFEELKKSGLKEGIESKLVTKNGEAIDVEIRSLSIYNKTGKFVKTFSIIRDMREMNTLRAQLVQQSKLAAIGELASGIMHDIRNPLTVITSYNDHFLKEALESKDFVLIKKCQASIEKAAKKIQRLTDHLREFTRKEKEVPEEFLLREIMDDCLLMVGNRVKMSGADVINYIKEKDFVLYARRNQLEQVIINILSNACDAVMGRDKRVIEISASLDAENKALQLSIKDTGIGIKEKDLEQIFEAFFTTKPKGQGTGLGLSITAGIVKEHSGTINVKSQYGEGTEFIVTLPFRLV